MLKAFNTNYSPTLAAKTIRGQPTTAPWTADVHHEIQRALAGQDPVAKVRSVLGWDGYDHSWNLVKYALGPHDDRPDGVNSVRHGAPVCPRVGLG